jgi:uncharacterized membrane protein
MPARQFPFRPHLDQLRNQAKDLLRDVRVGLPSALDDCREFHPERIDPAICSLDALSSLPPFAAQSRSNESDARVARAMLCRGTREPNMYSDMTAPHLPTETGRGLTLTHLDRLTSVAAAAGLMLYGIRRRDAVGIGLAAAAAPLVYRTITGDWPTALGVRRDEEDSSGTREALGGDRGFLVHQAIRLELPLGEVYRFWRRLENLPRFMSHLAAVTELDSRRSHWVARGPAGVLVEWDAEIINEVENQVIGWQSLPGGDVVVAGSVNFDAVRDGTSTQVTVRLQYAPPAGRVGSIVATLAGREPAQTIREDLRRLKQILEAGEVAQAPR